MLAALCRVWLDSSLKAEAVPERSELAFYIRLGDLRPARVETEAIRDDDCLLGHGYMSLNVCGNYATHNPDNVDHSTPQWRMLATGSALSDLDDGEQLLGPAKVRAVIGADGVCHEGYGAVSSEAVGDQVILQRQLDRWALLTVDLGGGRSFQSGPVNWLETASQLWENLLLAKRAACSGSTSL